MEVFVWLYVSIFFGHRTFWSCHRLPGNLTVRQDFRALLHVAEVHNLPLKTTMFPFCTLVGLYRLNQRDMRCQIKNYKVISQGAVWHIVYLTTLVTQVAQIVCTGGP